MKNTTARIAAVGALAIAVIGGATAVAASASSGTPGQGTDDRVVVSTSVTASPTSDDASNHAIADDSGHHGVATGTSDDATADDSGHHGVAPATSDDPSETSEPTSTSATEDGRRGSDDTVTSSSTAPGHSEGTDDSGHHGRGTEHGPNHQ